LSQGLTDGILLVHVRQARERRGQAIHGLERRKLGGSGRCGAGAPAWGPGR